MRRDSLFPRTMTGEPARLRRVGIELRGQLMPFGATAIVKLSTTTHKPDTRLRVGSVGIPFGYRVLGRCMGRGI